MAERRRQSRREAGMLPVRLLCGRADGTISRQPPRVAECRPPPAVGRRPTPAPPWLLDS